MTSVVKAFEKTHPGIRIVQQNVPFDQLFQQVEVRLGSGSTTPDIISVDAPLVAAYTVQGFLTPLDRYFSKVDLAQFTAAPLSTSYYLGHLTAPPTNSSSQALYYNKDVLKKAGVPFLRGRAGAASATSGASRAHTCVPTSRPWAARASSTGACARRSRPDPRPLQSDCPRQCT
jgi:maltose-binding protein MalE